MVCPDALAGVLGGSGAESRFLTTDDGVWLHLLHWPSERSPPWAAVIFLHGITSHGGWFASLDLEDRTYCGVAAEDACLPLPAHKLKYRRRMVETGQRADGQFKILRLTSDTAFAGEFAAERDLVGGERTSA